LGKVNFFDQTVDTLDSPKMRFAGNPFLSGKNGGHSLNLHQFARDGVVLLGRLKDVQNNKALLAPDLIENLTKIDGFVKEVKQKIDAYIDVNNIDADEVSEQDELRDGYESEVYESLDLQAAGIKTIVWAIGYDFDFSWIKFPVLDEYGYPVQKRGVAEIPGLYFLGLHWLYKRRSGLPWGVGDDAAHIADDIIGRA
jgi:putative flavoprotein involved in K+ transport